MRIALLVNILSPYRLPVYRALAATPGWELRIFVNAQSEDGRDWDVDGGSLDVQQLPGRARVRRGHTLHLPSPVATLRALAGFRPDVVVSSELGVRTLWAWLYASLARKPLVIWSYPTRERVARLDALRRRLGPFLLRRARAVIGMGREARLALAQLGVADERICDAPNAHQTGALEAALKLCDTEAARRGLRARGCRGQVALVAGRLLEMKGIPQLLTAWDRLPAPLREEWTLLFVGDGPQAPWVESSLQDRAHGEIVRLPAVPFEALVSFYAASDLLVFSSLSDPWGLVVNEAMACGLPAVCSQRAGCALDLIEPGRNGWLADPCDPERFADALAAAMTSERRGIVGAAARDTVSHFTPERMADGVRLAITRAVFQLVQAPTISE